ncbi:MAG: secondary thiamine-phosphate synthase enzyme YjbQ [Vicinamibacterales bacterium]
MDTLNGCGQVRTGAGGCEEVRAGADGCGQVRPFHATIRLSSRLPTEFVDLTDRVAALVARAGLDAGFVNIQTRHTTTAIVVNEHEPLLLADFRALLERTAPDDGRYRHDDLAVRTVNVFDGERPNGHAHCRALLLPCSAGLNVMDGRLRLGRWQRIFFLELDGPREREISVMLLGEVSR